MGLKVDGSERSAVRTASGALYYPCPTKLDPQGKSTDGFIDLIEAQVASLLREVVMKLLSSRVVFQALLLSLTAYAQAITVFSDDFDSLAVGEDINTQNGWRSESYDPESQFPAVPTGPLEGTTPFSGGQMLKMRSAIEKNGGHVAKNSTVQTSAPQYNGIFRNWSASIKAFVRSSLQEPMSVTLGISAGSSAAGYLLKIDLLSGNWFGQDRLARHSGTSSILHDHWNEFRIDVDWATLTCSPVINEETVGALKFDLPSPNSSNRYIRQFEIGQVTSNDLSNKYAYPEGAQPVYFDDYRVIAVPEPVTGLCILMAAWMCNRRRK